MIRPSTLLFATLVVPGMFAASASAAVVAFTNFDGRTLTTDTVTNDTATNLNWATNGVEDPGNMTSRNAAGTGLALFNGNPLVGNMFAPALNTGNGNTFWTTSVALTVSAGSTVTLTDVTFDYWSINGGQNQNVDRRSDFTISLLNPSAVVLDSIDIADALSGTVAGVPTVNVPFTAPIALIAPGTYTLQIKGGDYLPADETGNHTAIDNLSINGVVVVPEPSTLFLSVIGVVALLARRRR